MNNTKIREFHLFAGIGGGIYGGSLLNHECVGACEIGDYQKKVLKQRQTDGWLTQFPIYSDLCQLNGSQFKGTFDILCGGFPCQAFSTAAHGKNIAEKNLWGEMLRFVKESEAPVVFGENVVLRAIEKAKEDLEALGYTVKRIRLSCSDLGADHQRNRFWLLAVKDFDLFNNEIMPKLLTIPRLCGGCWALDPTKMGSPVQVNKKERRQQLLGVGNAQSPLVAATAFRILAERMSVAPLVNTETVTDLEISSVFDKSPTWIQTTFNNIGLVHTPTTMANYACASMMKHQGCRNFTKVFGKPEPDNAEYLMGFPKGASSPNPVPAQNFMTWAASVIFYPTMNVG